MSRRTSDEILAEHAADVAHTVGINMTKVALNNGAHSVSARLGSHARPLKNKR